jgi:TRAP-type C4-dicarboxylate transport system permease large subunit
MSTPASTGLLDRLLSVLLGLLLAVVLVTGLAPNTSTRVVGLGESVWPGYASELRADPQAPDCDVDATRQRAETCVEPAAPAPEPVDPFAPPEPEPDPFAPPEPEPDPFAPPEPEPDPFATPAPSTVSCAAVRALADRCATNWADHEAAVARISPSVKSYRALDRFVGAIALFPFHKHNLVLLVLLGGLVTSLRGAHISLREPGSTTEARLADAVQLVVHLAWLASSLADRAVQQESAAEADNAALPVIWALGFAALAAVHAYRLVRPPALKGDGRSLLVVPLYAWMGLLALGWFALEGHPSGQAIYLLKFVQIPSIYLGIGLYIWAGMLLARTSLASKVFDVLLPWRLPPAVLGWCVVVLAALPTAYSGASGIFVIAAGAVIFERLTAAGASPRLALAATAMSGSLGVVLRPCLVVVLVAVLNKSVTTDALFGWGLVVFGLTAALFLVAMLIRNDQPFERPDVGVAGPASLKALGALVPFAGLALVGLVVYGLLLGTVVNEHTAAWVLPGLLLLLAAYDRFVSTEGPAFGAAVVEATSEASHHIGALLFVMAGSVGVGGVVERAELLELLPGDFGSRWLAMTFLVVVMVLVGMTMDALGAVILVSVSLAHVADANGIDPVHFWMMVLCAFELGYLTPPVALNHLLARQVIGEPSYVENLPAASFSERYEHILLPMAVMATALVIVAYVPLLFTG